MKDWQESKRRRVEYAQVLFNTADLKNWERTQTDYVLGKRVRIPVLVQKPYLDQGLLEKVRHLGPAT